MPAILIVDDHLLIRYGLRQILKHEYRQVIFGEAKTGPEAQIRLTKRRWDLVIFGIALASEDDFYTLQEIRYKYPFTPVLVLSTNNDSLSAMRAKNMGACGYISKSANHADHLKAVKSLLDGHEYFGDFSCGGAAVEKAPRHASLSTREYAVMMAFARGKRSGEIAAELKLSIKTVSTYKSRLLNKLMLSSTADLIRYVIDQRLS